MPASRPVDAPSWVALEGADPKLELAAVDRLLARGQHAIVTATLGGDAVALGRFQRRRSDEPLRRWCGGRATRYGEGVLSLSIIAPGSSTQLRGEQILRRHAQRVVRALNALGVPAAYPGRDFLTVAGLRAGTVSLEKIEEGSTLFQTLLAVDGRELFVHPPPEFPGLPPYPPSGPLGSDIGPRLAETLVPALAPEAEPGNPTGGSDHTTPEPTIAGLVSAGPAEVPIGELEAWVALDPQGRLSTVRVLGDWIASSADVDQFERALVGRTPTDASLTPLVKRWLSLPGAIHVGVTEPEPILRAIVESARLARAHTLEPA